MVPLALVVNLATRWRTLQSNKFPPGAATSIGFKFGFQVVPLELSSISRLASSVGNFGNELVSFQPESRPLSL